MKLKGILDFSLGNFLCLRGFAPMGELYDISEADPSFQRDLLKEHEKEMVAFLRDGEFLFFPEVILATTLSPEETDNDEVRQLFQDLAAKQPFANLKFSDFRMACKLQKTKQRGERRAFEFIRIGTLEFNSKLSRKISRIDGNHRLSATPKDSKFRDHNTPFCLLLFRNTTDAAKFSRALFHNINYKSVPLEMEQSLKLILDDEKNLFPDSKLKEHEFFGWSYYLARKMRERINFVVLPNLAAFFETAPRTLWLRLFQFLIGRGALGGNENAMKRTSAALGPVNSLFDAHPGLKASTNPGLLTALVYFQIEPRVPVIAFVRWVLANHLHEIAESNPSDLVAIFDKIMLSRKRTIFVSMPFGKDTTENHFTEIANVVAAINRDYPDFKPQLKVQRVDFLQAGTSFPIRAKIDEFMANCGLLIANLTYCNPNVYHEVGFMDGKAKALDSDKADVLLFLDESVAAKEKLVGFNLSGSKQIRFKRTADFTKQLRENLEAHFKLKH